MQLMCFILGEWLQYGYVCECVANQLGDKDSYSRVLYKIEQEVLQYTVYLQSIRAYKF